MLDRPIPKERNPAVEAFKKSLMLGQECQASLVNYRASLWCMPYLMLSTNILRLIIGRDGEAFLNLISVVPIRWKEESGEDKEYYVGFQVDVRNNAGPCRSSSLKFSLYLSVE